MSSSLLTSGTNGAALVSSDSLLSSPPFLKQTNAEVYKKNQKGNSNIELGTALCYVNVENYFLTIIKHVAVPSSKLEIPFIKRRGW